MNLLGAFNALLNRQVNYDKYSYAFTRLVHDLVHDKTISLSVKGEMLHTLEAYLNRSKFVGIAPKELVQARKDLLHLWEYLLGFVQIITLTNYKEMCFGLILLIIQREEFSLEAFQSIINPEKVSPLLIPQQKELEYAATKYQHLLMKTYNLMCASMNAKRKYAEIVHFSAQLLAIFFFRLPFLGAQVIDALEKKAREHTVIKKERSSSTDDHEKFVLTETESIAGNDISPIDLKTADRLEINVPLTEEQERMRGEKDVNNNNNNNKMKRKLQRHHEQTEEERRKDSKFIKDNPSLFQWSSFQINTIGDSKKVKTSINEEGAKTCMFWLTTKESFFLTFAEMFVYHVQRMALNEKEIRWRIVPAYELLLECFWPLLRSAIWWDSISKRITGEGEGWVTSYPGYMRVKRTAIAFLSSNRSLLNSYIRITYECSNAFSLLSVDSCIEHLNLWFSVAATENKSLTKVDIPTMYGLSISSSPTKSNEAPGGKFLGLFQTQNTSSVSPVSRQILSLPNSFDYFEFWPPFSILLESESFQMLLKTISFLYNNMHLFQSNIRKQLVNDILTKHFFRLFLHWSAEVRMYFQHFIVYKLFRYDRRFLPCFTDEKVMLEFLPMLDGDNIEARVAAASPNKPANVITDANNVPLPVIQQQQFEQQQVKRERIQELNQNLHSNNSNETNFNVVEKAKEISEKAMEVLDYGKLSDERRLGLLNSKQTVDDVELLNDMAHSSKIDSFIKISLLVLEDESNYDSLPLSIPKECIVYIKPAMIQYAALLLKYYQGVKENSLDELIPTLGHRMILSDTNPFAIS